MKVVVKVEELNCCCTGSDIRGELLKLSGVYKVDIDRANRTVIIEHTDELDRSDVVGKLAKMGYKEIDN